ncbi:heavy-metal-associated domain-containing protein [Massilia sp. TS11]|uniref:heavy-metal-associated domain-containing protein n=1 Tax=Massilia sp. TS11 TaxID=2908003 RepID=UPI001EDC28DE|nr:heavy-metal-associated domain-containing protein [Massilia sp. TS11]MCG2584339.1 heavy-metal-associated domain-containing protein [Massilia sp. TS11]
MYELQVERMRCGGCAGQVSSAIKAADPAAHIEIDLAGQTLHIESSLALENIAELVQGAGYPVRAARNL